MFYNIDMNVPPKNSFDIHEVIRENDTSFYIRKWSESDAEFITNLVASNLQHHSQYGDSTGETFSNIERSRETITALASTTRTAYGVWNDEIMVGSVCVTLDEHSIDGEIGYWTWE